MKSRDIQGPSDAAQKTQFNGQVNRIASWFRTATANEKANP